MTTSMEKRPADGRKSSELQAKRRRGKTMKIVRSHLSRKSECKRVSIISYPKMHGGPRIHKVLTWTPAQDASNMARQPRFDHRHSYSRLGNMTRANKSCHRTDAMERAETSSPARRRRQDLLRVVFEAHSNKARHTASFKLPAVSYGSHMSQNYLNGSGRLPTDVSNGCAVSLTFAEPMDTASAHCPVWHCRGIRSTPGPALSRVRISSLN